VWARRQATLPSRRQRCGASTRTARRTISYSIVSPDSGDPPGNGGDNRVHAEQPVGTGGRVLNHDFWSSVVRLLDHLIDRYAFEGTR
jgi:hypothetical protein